MRLINKKSLILLTSILLVITTILVLKQTKNIELSEVKLLESSNNNSFAMYRETNNGYEEYDSDKFPEGYVLNITESKCLDNKGNEQKGILSYENGLVTVTSGNTSYCYLYFDESLGLEIKNKKPNRLSTEVKGDMYRFQGNQTDNVENYICFGTSDKQTCIEHPDQYMYRIIGIESKTGRVKVIKKEALDQTYQWHTSYVEDVAVPNSSIIKMINETGFLDNPTYIPEGWKDKISDSNWMYGNGMLDNDSIGAQQIGEGLYETESGKKKTNWFIKSTQEGGGEPYNVEWDGNTYYPQGTTLYYKFFNEKWADMFNSKISLMYLNDYSYSISDEAKCNFTYGEEEYAKCKLGWIHLSNNDLDAKEGNEWTMVRSGWLTWHGALGAFYISSDGFNRGDVVVTNSWSIRPVFYIDASQTLKDGTGTIDDLFIIN